jgi:hypothetical protein
MLESHWEHSIAPVDAVIVRGAATVREEGAEPWKWYKSECTQIPWIIKIVGTRVLKVWDGKNIGSVRYNRGTRKLRDALVQ